jgi:hypothetical protein
MGSKDIQALKEREGGIYFSDQNTDLLDQPMNDERAARKPNYPNTHRYHKTF